MADPVSLAAKLVAALMTASEEDRARALALVRIAFPDESAKCLRERRERDANRKRNVRGRSEDSPRNVRGQSTDVPRSGPALSADKGGGGVSLSLDSSGDSPSSRQISSESDVTDAAREAFDPDVLVAMTEDWELDEETRAAAAIAGLKGVDAAWAAYRAESLDKPLRSRRTWLAKFLAQWVPRAKRYETADAARGPSLRRPTLVVQPKGGVWKAGDGT